MYQHRTDNRPARKFDGPHTNKHGQTISCPECGETNNLSVYRYANQDHYYCQCGLYGTISQVDDLPTHAAFRRTCTVCGELGGHGVQALYYTKKPYTHAKCMPPKLHLPCSHPGCAKKANRTTHAIPYKPMCTWHFYRQPGMPQTLVGQHGRNVRRHANRKATNWRNGIGYDALRAQARHRDNNQCVWCGHDGTTHRLEVDHIQEEWFAPDLIADLDNLQTLCSQCHSAKGNAVRAALYELARQNPLHYNLLADQLIAETRTEKAH